MDISKAIKNLEAALAGTQEFVTLKQAQQKIIENTSLNQMVNALQQKQAQLYSANLSQTQAQHMMQEISKDYEYLLTFPEAKAYFGATEQLNVLLNNIMSQVYNTLQS